MARFRIERRGMSFEVPLLKPAAVNRWGLTPDLANKPWNIRTNRFWYEHPELHRCPEHDRLKDGGWMNTLHALDYSKPAVQEFEFGIVKELVDRYDAEGFELDFMRFWENLPPGAARALRLSPAPRAAPLNHPCRSGRAAWGHAEKNLSFSRPFVAVLAAPFAHRAAESPFEERLEIGMVRVAA